MSEQRSHKGWGGSRLGAGRKPALIPKKNRSFYVSDDEYNALKEFLTTFREKNTPACHIPKRIMDSAEAAEWIREAQEQARSMESEFHMRVHQVWEDSQGNLTFQFSDGSVRTINLEK